MLRYINSLKNNYSNIQIDMRLIRQRENGRIFGEHKKKEAKTKTNISQRLESRFVERS